MRGVRELPARPAGQEPAAHRHGSRRPYARGAGNAAAPAAPTARDARLDEQTATARQAGRPLPPAAADPAWRPPRPAQVRGRRAAPPDDAGLRAAPLL